MCLGVPGQVVEILDDPLGMTMGRVSFAGITKEVCLAYLPAVEVGDYVIVHVGFAISKVDEQEARQVFEWLEQMGELEELDIPQSGDRSAAPGSNDASLPRFESADDGESS
jgi:hydrogenase expression/formation protein HypC